jgi:hypothetical protein
MVKYCPEYAVPPAVVTETFPEVAPAGTVTVRELVLAAVTVAAVPLKATAFSDGMELK